MATIYLIRHGQASFGAEDYDKLSELGRRQAVVAGEYLRGHGIKLDAVYSGDLLRQHETAQLALASQPGDVPHHVDARFNEIRNDEQLKYLLPQLLETNPTLKALVERGLGSSKDYQKAIEATFNYWVSPDCDDTRIQSWMDYSGGVHAALQALIQNQGRGKTIGVFTSGGTIATIVGQVLGLDGAQTYPLYEPIFNCSITQLFYNGSKVSLSYFNDRSYLQVYGLSLGESLVSYR